MSTLKVALLQIMPENTIQENLEKGLEYCRKAKAADADIALFPEMWSVSYCIPEDITELKSLSLLEDSEFVCPFQELAKELNMAIGITFLEAHDPLPRNTICLFDRFGKKVYTYAKVHTCDFADEKTVEAGKEFKVCDFEGIKFSYITYTK